MHGRFPVWHFKRIAMKEGNNVNAFWAIIWGLVLALGIAGMFWCPAIIGVIVVSAIMFGLFVYDYVRFERLK